MWWLSDGSIAKISPVAKKSKRDKKDVWDDLRQRHPPAHEAAVESQARLVNITSSDDSDQPPCRLATPQSSGQGAELLIDQLEAEATRRVAVEQQLAAVRLRHAEELATLRQKNEAIAKTARSCERERRVLVVKIGQHETLLAKQHAALKQARHHNKAASQESKAAIQASELKRATEAQALRAELDSLQRSIQDKDELYVQLEATLEQRDAAQAIELKQGRDAADTLLREIEQKHSDDVQALRSESESLQTSLHENESVRAELELTLKECADAHVAELQQVQVAAEASLRDSKQQHAADMEVLRSELEAKQALLNQNEVMRGELESTMQERDAVHVLELQQAHEAAEALLKDDKKQRSSEVRKLQSELKSLRKALKKNEGNRAQLEAVVKECEAAHAANLAKIKQQDVTHAAACLQAEQALARAEARADELAAQLNTFQLEATTQQSVLTQERLERSAVESDLRAANCQLSSESENLRSEIETLRNAAAERDAAFAQQLGQAEQACQEAAGRVRLAEDNFHSLCEETESLESRLVSITKERASIESKLKQSQANHEKERESWHQQLHVLQAKLGENEAIRQRAEAAIERQEAKYTQLLVDAGQAREDALVQANLSSAEADTLRTESASLRAKLQAEIENRLSVERKQRKLQRVFASKSQAHQSQLKDLEKRLEEHEVARQKFELARVATAEAHVTELAKTNAARQTAEQRCANVEDQRLTLRREVEAYSVRIDEVSAARAAAETSLKRLTGDLRQLRQQGKSTVRDYHDLQRTSAEEHARLASEATQLRQDVNDRKRQLTERDTLIAQQLTELKKRQEAEQALQCERKKVAEQHAEQIRSLEQQIGDLRSKAEAAKDQNARLAGEAAQQVEDLLGQLAGEKERCLSWQTEVTKLQKEQSRRQNELGQLREALEAAETEHRAAQSQLQEQVELIKSLQQEMHATKLAASESDSQKVEELAAMQVAISEHSAQLLASRDTMTKLEHQLQEAIQGEQTAIQRAEAFRSLAQREAAERRKLAVAIKHSVDGAASDASLHATRVSIEVNERIRRLTAELVAMRNHELSVRQRAIKAIKRARKEVRHLKEQLSKERKAA